MSSTSYTKEFFEQFESGSFLSAKEIVPFVLNLVKPESVVDVGCGTGTWLSVFRQKGIKNILGIDGGYVNQQMLKIPETQFLALDLTKPIHLNREFDLVVSLEVAEHLPEKCAENFINSLVSLGSVILFSAAIPHQGGVSHLNERWPEYWRNFFNKRSYVVIDCLRERIWNNPKVDWWYAQNILLYVKKGKLKNYPFLEQEFKTRKSTFFSIVHPRCYQTTVDKYPQSITSLIKKLFYRNL